VLGVLLDVLLAVVGVLGLVDLAGGRAQPGGDEVRPTFAVQVLPRPAVLAPAADSSWQSKPPSGAVP